MSRGPVAAVDCGTNSTRLLILDERGRRLARRMEITRLGQGIDRSRELDPSAVARTVRVLAEYAALASKTGVVETRAVATSALRDARDAATFLQPAAQVLGTEVEVIAGDEEGRLSFRGATESLDPALGPFLVLDIGGGSTEFISGGSSGTIHAVSLEVGCVRVTERYLQGDPPAARELEEARAAVRRVLSDGLGDEEPWRSSCQLVGLAGTVSALTVLSLGLEGFDEEAVHHARLSRKEVSRLCGELAGLTLAERRQVRGMEEARADVIVGGALVLDEAMGYLGQEELVTSEQDILDGMARGLLEGKQA